MPYDILLSSYDKVRVERSQKVVATNRILGVSRHSYLDGWTIDHVPTGSSIIPVACEELTFHTMKSAKDAAIGFWDRLSKRDKSILSEPGMTFDEMMEKKPRARRAIKWLKATLESGLSKPI